MLHKLFIFRVGNCGPCNLPIVNLITTINDGRVVCWNNYTCNCCTTETFRVGYYRLAHYYRDVRSCWWETTLVSFLIGKRKENDILLIVIRFDKIIAVSISYIDSLDILILPPHYHNNL